MSQITTHVIDTSRGRPAWGVAVVLYEQIAHEWFEISNGITNNDGRLFNLLHEDVELSPGIYKLSFDIKLYFSARDVKTFYPMVEVIFDLKTSGGHYHIPLLISPFGYSTYRGS